MHNLVRLCHLRYVDIKKIYERKYGFIAPMKYHTKGKENEKFKV